MAQLKRSENKMIAGVCAGIAERFNISAGAVRLIWALCVLLGGFGILAYLIMWILMPKA
jgi:phage shock protein PspC (stress-responsive transcriptional regulator)